MLRFHAPHRLYVVQWHEALEEASRLYFGEQDVEGMLHTLLPLHTKLNASMRESPDIETKSEKFFKMVRRSSPFSLLRFAPCHKVPCHRERTCRVVCFV